MGDTLGRFGELVWQLIACDPPPPLNWDAEYMWIKIVSVSLGFIFGVLYWKKMTKGKWIVGVCAWVVFAIAYLLLLRFTPPSVFWDGIVILLLFIYPNGALAFLIAGVAYAPKRLWDLVTGWLP